MISSVDLAQYGISRAKVSVDCGTTSYNVFSYEFYDKMNDFDFKIHVVNLLVLYDDTPRATVYAWFDSQPLCFG